MRGKGREGKTSLSSLFLEEQPTRIAKIAQGAKKKKEGEEDAFRSNRGGGEP